PNPARLGRAAGRVVLGIEVEDDLAPPQGAEGDLAPIVGPQREVGRLGAFLDLRHTPSVATRSVLAAAGQHVCRRSRVVDGARAILTTTLPSSGAHALRLPA